MNKDVFVIIPVFNEESTVREVASSVIHKGYTLVLVNDGSSDGSGKVMQTISGYYLAHEFNRGQGAALQTGISFSLTRGAQYLITFDADAQHSVDDIEKLLDPLYRNEADIAFGSRFLEGSFSNMPFSRKIAVRLARWLNYFLSGLLLTDAHNGLRALNRKAAGSIYITEAGMAHASEIHMQAASSKLRVKEVPVSIRYTAYSKSKGQSGWNGLRIFFDLIFHKLSK